ncbi:MAG: DUF3108 domain-containing protein [Deltaproteobacteria bacterium]
MKLKSNHIGLVIAIMLACLFDVKRLWAAQPPRTIADAFLDEELTYAIGFWVFDDVAIGKVTFKRADDGDYVATLEAYTTGVVDWVLRNRRDTYRVHMRMSADGKRFISKTFEKSIEMGGKTRRGLTVFDYEKRLMTWRSWGGGKDERSGVEKLPPNIHIDDPITAFYNFRYGVYGPPVEGREYTIYSFPKGDETPHIYLRVATRPELEARRGVNLSADYLAFARIDKDLFGSQSGDVEVLFTSEMLPNEAVARDILFFGDVRGRLVKIGVGMDFKTTAAPPAPRISAPR